MELKHFTDIAIKNIMKTLLVLSLVLNVILTAIVIYRMNLERSHYDVVMFGDSIINHGKWKNAKNSGISDFTTSHLINVLNDKVIKYNPHKCFIEGGINDIAVGIPLERTYKNFESIVDSLLNNGITPIIQSTLYVTDPIDYKIFNPKVDSLNQFLIQLSKKKGIQYIDINSHLSENGKLKSEYTVDGVHLNESAYKVWAKLIE